MDWYILKDYVVIFIKLTKKSSCIKKNSKMLPIKNSSIYKIIYYKYFFIKTYLQNLII